MADLFWLFISSLWGTIRLLNARIPSEFDEDDWSFGQIMPVFLLLGPIMTVSVSIVGTFRRQQRLQTAGIDSIPSTQVATMLGAHQDGSIKSYVSWNHTLTVEKLCQRADKQLPTTRVLH
ncbi:hypothetical protein GQ607_007808 [Colletotrichum asianum]|uniref:Uncharacterized protein n=1 Tax=Colletotrichum asianum TaxID=702518 RepID=A0A8H3WEL0_9PEZI|nr:hypothetical protein GQ607_007808 [Colletotrichum asianum]